MSKSSICALLIGLVIAGCQGGEEAEEVGGAEDPSPEATLGRPVADPWSEVNSQASRSSSDSTLLAALGGALFRTPPPTGNGRACSTCHLPNKNFTISPADIEERFQKNPNDPLFRSIDADDFANDFTTVRTKGLFRVTVSLPPNVKLADDPTATSVKIFRSVPTVQNVKLTGPFTQDGRELTLASQAKAATFEHGRPTQAPPDLAFDLIARFEERQFSSNAIKNVSNLLDNNQTPPPVGQDYDRPLNALEQQGFAAFQANCIICHGGNARAEMTLFPFPTSFVTILISEFNRAGLEVRDYDVTNPDGTVTRVSSPDPGRMLITGKVADAGFFDVTQLRGVSKTAPYFHDNSSPDLRDVLNHYNTIFPIFGFPTIPAGDFEPLLAYLNRL
jgi:cytochrome c peroxidase